MGLKKLTTFCTKLGLAMRHPAQGCDDDDRVEALEALGALELRKRIDEQAGTERWELRDSAKPYGVIVWFTTPNWGKHMNPIEIVWSICKQRFRRES